MSMLAHIHQTSVNPSMVRNDARERYVIVISKYKSATIEEKHLDLEEIGPKPIDRLIADNDQ